MIESRAVVTEVQGEYAWVDAERALGCGRCRGQGCASGALTRLFCGKPRRFRVRNPVGARVGEAVIVGIDDGAILQSSLAAYIVPLLLLISGAVLGAAAGGEPGSIAGAAVGLCAGLAGARLYGRFSAARFDPRIIADEFTVIEEVK